MNSDRQAAGAAALPPPDEELHDRVGHVGDDAGEDDQRRAVADALVGDQLAEPHDDGGARRQREHGDRGGTPRPGSATTSAPPLREALDVASR